MIISIIATIRSIEIEDARNFRAFMVRIEGRFEDQADLDELLSQAAISVTREHAWIAESWLREWPALAGEPWWQDGLSDMIAAAHQIGWVDQTNHAIRAHINYSI